MNTDTKIYLKKRFKNFYWNTPVKAPSEVERREFGTGTLDSKIKVRHKSFRTGKELNNFLKREAPFYISYSAAYYEFPENQPMTTKNWDGADLIFDLDVDMDYLEEGGLGKVKNETLNLLSFLLDDFGYSKKDVAVNFSGGKGYHVHVSSPEVRDLGRDERQEVVDYVTGSGFELSDFFVQEAVKGVDLEAKGDFRSRRDSTALTRGPSAGDVGWGKRAYEIALDFVSSDVDKLKKEYRMPPKRADLLVRNREANMRMLRDGRWDGLVGFTDYMKKRVVERYAVELVGDADKMVTVDTTRLIRLPDTLHGGSGLIAKTVEDIDSFNPLVDAVAFGGDEVSVELSGKVPAFSLFENRFGPYKKDKIKIPEYAAVYLLLKGMGEIVG